MRRRIAVVVAGTVLALGAATLWLPTSLSPAFHPDSVRPRWPEVLAVQPLWRILERASTTGPTECVIETDGDVAAGGGAKGASAITWITNAGYVDVREGSTPRQRVQAPVAVALPWGEDDAWGWSAGGRRALGIVWTTRMGGGHVYWPLLAAEHALIALIATAALVALFRHERRRQTATAGA